MSVVKEINRANLEQAVTCKKKILLVNFSNPLSHGGAAIALSTIKSLSSIIPDAEIYIMATRDFDVSVYTGTYGFSPACFVKHTWFRSRNSPFGSLLASAGPAVWAYLSSVSYNWVSRLGLKRHSIYEDYDLVIDLSSDSLNQYYGIVYPVFSLFQLDLLLLCKKKIVVFPASIGPFKNPILKRWVRSTLSKTDLVIAREQTTLDFLRKVGVPEKKIHFAADLAFLFEPASLARVKVLADELGIKKGERPLIGIAPSSEIHRYCFPDITEPKRKYAEYIRLMAELTDYVIEQFDVNVVFIPHFVFPTEFIKNDKISSQDIYDQLKHKDRVRILLADYRADEVKGIIGLCDLVISCRMHAAIASTSSAIPTVALSFGHKFHSVLGKMLGQDKCIVKSDADYNTVLSNLKQTVTYTWNNRVAINAELDQKRLIVKEKALSTFYKTKELICPKHKSPA